MSYGQINYQQKVGNSNLTIAEVGCFVTADCNLLEGFGVNVDPPTLNSFYESHGIYTYDVTDHANDDITWGSATSYSGGVVLDSVVNAPGWPQSNEAIVKFHYKSHSGYMTTHFCKVADWSKQLIVDSWDGKVKSPGTYYGEPIAHATYRFNNPTPAPIVQPAVVTATQDGSPNYDGHSITVQHGWGLSNVAEASGWPDFGQPARWQAIASQNGSNDWQAYNRDLKAGERIVVGRYDVPTPTPTPSTVEPAKQTDIVYTKWEGPTEFTTNKSPTHKWQLNFVNDVHATSAADLPIDATIIVYGKAQRTDGDKPVYLMTQGDFGNADTTGIPTNNSGINMVDLTPVPTTAAPSSPSAAPHPNVEGQAESIPVKVVHWQDTINVYTTPVKDEVVINTLIHDLEGKLSDQQLVTNQPITIAGDQTVNGVKYGFTPNSLTNKTYYGIPLTGLKQLAIVNDEDSIFAGILDEIEAEAVKIKESAKANGLVSRFMRKK
jgi:hypothetical protein